MFSGIIALTAIATFGSEHETSMIAFIVGAVLFCLSYLLPRTGVKFMALVWALVNFAGVAFGNFQLQRQALPSRLAANVCPCTNYYLVLYGT